MIELMKTPEGIARVDRALNRGERTIAEQIENQPSQWEIIDGVRDGLRKAHAEDLRFEDRVERMPLRLNLNTCLHVTYRLLIRLLSLGEMGETLLTRPTFTMS